jgi:hypothetical protein
LFISLKEVFSMPGEIGDETESQQVGYKGHAYPQTGEFMQDERQVCKNDKEDQKNRVRRRMRENFFQEHEIPHSMLPDGGPSQGSASNPL